MDLADFLGSWGSSLRDTLLELLNFEGWRIPRFSIVFLESSGIVFGIGFKVGSLGVYDYSEGRRSTF